jgi:Fe-S oxidoreductase
LKLIEIILKYLVFFTAIFADIQETKYSALHNSPGAITIVIIGTSFLNVNCSLLQGIIEERDLVTSYTETVASQCIECNQCTEECDFLITFGKTPKKLANEILNISFFDNSLFPYSCNICGYCQKLCPNDLDLGLMIMEAREKLVLERIGPLSGHQPAIEGQEFYISENFRFVSAGKGVKSCDTIFFPGCALSAYSPNLVKATYSSLTVKYPDLGIALGCCGGPSELIGKTGYANQITEKLEQDIKRLGASEIVIACPYCYKRLSEQLTYLKPVSLYNVLSEAGVKIPETGNSTYSIHDPCSARNQPIIHDAMRSLISKAGYTIDETTHTRENTHCCGMGGMVFLVNTKVGAAKAQRTIGESSYDLVTYCATCRDIFSGQGKRCVHVLDLLFNKNSDEQAGKAPNSPEIATTNLKSLNRWVRDLATEINIF